MRDRCLKILKKMARSLNTFLTKLFNLLLCFTVQCPGICPFINISEYDQKLNWK